MHGHLDDNYQLQQAPLSIASAIDAPTSMLRLTHPYHHWNFVA